ncbi:CPBP family intramembrane glutamic endopeptidase [Myceligenerans indicum]|uniref:CPBP family intramembrane glutamic endopeptidase n=1 Tax=Myceligenerans indicum TaxID=2593663 RepID=UPI00191F5C4D|nr:CPBP family intramembrane glutamic endopeptidase [Myceligenerans indicum]
MAAHRTRPTHSSPAARAASPRWLGTYVVLALAFSWAWWIPMAVTGQVSRAGQGWPTHLIGLTGPALAAIVVTALADGGPGLAGLWRRAVRLRVQARWWVLVGATLALSGLGFVVGRLDGTPVPLGDLTLYSGAPAAQGLTLLLVACYLLVVNGYGEELGWRGFLAHHLLPRFGRLGTATLVWVAWALWHAPLFLVVQNFRDFGPAGTVGWLVGLWFGSYFLTWLYESAGYSVLVVAAWHVAYNIDTATEATAGLTAAVVSTLVMAAVVLLLVRAAVVRHAGSRAHGAPASSKEET